MPRQNVYMKQKTLDGIREIVDDRRNEGASTSDANISSVCAEMLEIGMRVTLNMKKRTSPSGESKEDIFRRALLEECVKSKLVTQQILMILFSLQDVKDDSRWNYSELVKVLKESTTARVEEVLSDNKE
ncbi:conjugal transfer relaxosome DNA-binding protein TraM [Klebsiella aerogenes]|uniref:conjugal transfer relaxosome DNA-binding protein TraM n=1 Tax=Klebsiella aerogenes TaxID=548 RepID=UPI000DA1A666|nr:conjugal transfer relaxosome DNA-binding protein TraM [Klebsiella aerogenes]HCB2859856.1 relaxosome protein TraM [Klebsiella aerogenes]HCB2864859.1 relaxosome protein TraM [Klebsiella aerogenes]HCB2880469.1 relaxosome protein TraM [Klebsiella aerogenes]HCB3345922.1 relaxosome protein TraM [Klebsiella aerogenes]HCM1811924.1 relaxosome protein TraM [Klebsiella aerogenes]